MLLRWDTVSAREGRFARTALLAFLAAGWSAMVLPNANEPAHAAPFFVLMGLAMAALGYELNSQAHRRSQEGVDQWTRTDTGIIVVLIGYAVVLSLTVAVGPLPGHGRSSAASLSALYLILAACFGWAEKGP